MRNEFTAVCRKGADYVVFTLGHVSTGLEHSWSLMCSWGLYDIQNFVGHLRFELWEAVDVEQEFTAARVFPQVTPREADNLDTIYMVGIQEHDTRLMPILVVVWTMLEDGYHVERIPLEAPRLLQCEHLLPMVGVDVVCAHHSVSCEISHDSHPCRRQSWFVQEGMTFAIDIMPASLPEQEDENVCGSEGDDVSLVQQGAPCTHARQNVLAASLTAARRLQHQWCYRVWWHDRIHLSSIRREFQSLHKRRDDCMICQASYAFRQQLGSQSLLLKPVMPYSAGTADWYVAKPIEERCNTWHTCIRKEGQHLLLCLYVLIGKNPMRRQHLQRLFRITDVKSVKSVGLSIASSTLGTGMIHWTCRTARCFAFLGWTELWPITIVLSIWRLSKPPMRSKQIWLKKVLGKTLQPRSAWAWTIRRTQVKQMHFQACSNLHVGGLMMVDHPIHYSSTVQAKDWPGSRQCVFISWNCRGLGMKDSLTLSRHNCMSKGL